MEWTPTIGTVPSKSLFPTSEWEWGDGAGGKGGGGGGCAYKFEPTSGFGLAFIVCLLAFLFGGFFAYLFACLFVWLLTYLYLFCLFLRGGDGGWGGTP